MDRVLAKQIEGLRRAKASELKARYRELFGEDSPSSNRAHLFRRIAWRMQARVAGDLSERARQRAAELADDADLRRRAPRDFWRLLESQHKDGHQRRDPRLPPAGTVVRRSYRGQSIEVEIVAEGFAYQGQTYPSLSAIASHVTGTRWNGYAFFGLNQGRRHG